MRCGVDMGSSSTKWRLFMEQTKRLDKNQDARDQSLERQPRILGLYPRWMEETASNSGRQLGFSWVRRKFST